MQAQAPVHVAKVLIVGHGHIVSYLGAGCPLFFSIINFSPTLMAKVVTSGSL